MKLMRTQTLAIALWTIISVGLSLCLGFVIMLLTTIGTIDAHKTSSAPGDFAETEALVIFSDICANLWVASTCIFMIGLVYYVIMKQWIENYSTAFNHRRVSTFFKTLFVLNLLILFSLPIAANISYWKERTPYFPK